MIVEGYLDALALVEAGIGYAVASLGTAFTLEQLRLAKRFAIQDVLVFFDGDPAGKKAADRAFNTFSLCIETGVWGQGAFLPEGLDPDTFVRTRGTAATLALLEHAVPLWEFFLQRHDPGPGASVPERVRAAAEIKAVIDNVRERDPGQYGILVKQAAERLGIDETSFREIRTGSVPRASRPAHAAVESPEVFRREEQMLVEAMALDCEVARLVSHRAVLRHFSSVRLAEAGAALVTAWEREKSTASAIDGLPLQLKQRVTAELLTKRDLGTGDPLQVARDCIERIERRVRALHARQLRGNLRQAETSGDEGRLREELERFNEDLHRRKEIGHG